MRPFVAVFGLLLAGCGEPRVTVYVSIPFDAPHTFTLDATRGDADDGVGCHSELRRVLSRSFASWDEMDRAGLTLLAHHPGVDVVFNEVPLDIDVKRFAAQESVTYRVRRVCRFEWCPYVARIAESCDAQGALHSDRDATFP